LTTRLTIEIARRALPYLVHAAQMREVLTYGGLAEKVGCHWRTLRLPLYYIKDNICAPRSLPPLTAIVVSQATHLPGSGFLPEGTPELSPEEYRQEFEAFRDRVFTFKHWDRLLDELDLQPLTSSDAELDVEGRAYARYLTRQGMAAEGEPHRKLKEFIASHPSVIGLAPVRPAIREYLFPSGDECDVTFELEDGTYAVVEVKNGEHSELIKGMYQAVKYRALMAAEKGHGQPVRVYAIIVAYSIPDDIVAFATKLGITCRIVPEVR
jgi:hypothetical protein